MKDGEAREYVRFTRTAGGAKIAPEEVMDADAALAKEGSEWETAAEESELLSATGQDHDQEMFLAGQTSPVIFASAMLNFGVRQILDTLVELAPPPRGREDLSGKPREVTDPFSAVVFKVQAGMDTAHRDRLAFMRIRLRRVRSAAWLSHTPKPASPITTKYAQTVFGRERSTVESAFPGDVVGLVNATALSTRPHAVHREEGGVPADSVVRAGTLLDPARRKRRQVQAVPPVLSTNSIPRGVVQILRNDIRGRRLPRPWRLSARCSSRSSQRA